jgi:hypothetical protein
VKVLVFGDSATVSKLLPEASGLPSLLQAQLRERFPEQETSVRSRYWVHLPESGVERVLGAIERQKPDYLILAPTITWVTFTRADIAFKRWTPSRFHTLLHRTLRVNRLIQRRLFLSRWPRLAYTYSAPFRALGNLLGAKPFFTVPEALDAFEQVLITAKRQETTEIIVLEGPEYHLRAALVDPDPTVQRVLRNLHIHAMLSPKDLQLVEQFRAGVLALCRQHHAKVVDIWSVPVRDIWHDGIHPGLEMTRLQTDIICDAVTELERTYTSSQPLKHTWWSGDPQPKLGPT